MPLSRYEYTVAYICPMGVELAPVQAMLDETHANPTLPRSQNSYVLGEIEGHNVVITMLPMIGTCSAATVVTQLLNDFPSVKFGLLVGIGGGIPHPEHGIDIRLGDVVVSKPSKNTGGVIQYDMGKETINGFEKIGSLNKPPLLLLSTIEKLAAQHKITGTRIPFHLTQMLQKHPGLKQKYQNPGADNDRLFQSMYEHVGGMDCSRCDGSQVLPRAHRSNLEPLIHYGTIGSANRVLKNAMEREKLKTSDGIICVEMEAAGLMDVFPCLVIRGICDYADSHKTKSWQPYAAATAAAYMRELLSVITPQLTSKILDKQVTESLNELQATDPELDMERIESSKDALIKDCYDWIHQDQCLRKWQDGVGDINPILWLSGDPGKGKTMLMIALVREYLKSASRDSAPATFFFCQNTDARLNNPISILRGLIWKLGIANPPLAEIFHTKYSTTKHMLGSPNAIYALFSVFSTMLDAAHQAVVFIDALDECQPGAERDDFLKLIAKHARSSKVKWFVSSRNYPEIRQLLESESQVLSLELNKEHISKAVVTFISRKVDALGQAKQYSTELKQRVEKELVRKSDSTFLWVALVCKKLFKVTKRKALSTLEEMPPGLRDLYARMLGLMLQGEDEDDRDLCLRILRAVALAFRPLSMEELVVVADLPPELLQNDSLLELIELCGSFIVVRERTVNFVHQSAKDYLTMDAAHEAFSKGARFEHGLFVERSLHFLSKCLKQDICDLKHPGAIVPKSTTSALLSNIAYVSTFWVDHLSIHFDIASAHDSLRYLSDQGPIHQFFLTHLLHWFEALSLLGELDRGIVGLYSVQQMLRHFPPTVISNHQTFVHDAIRIFRQCRPAIEVAPLQVYSSAIIFAPESSHVRQHFKRQMPYWISPFRYTRKDWSSCLQTLEGHTSSIFAVEFSPNGQFLASAEIDGIVQIWNPVTGTLLQTLEGDAEEEISSAFSPDSQKFTLRMFRNSISVWDVVVWKEVFTLACDRAKFLSDGKLVAWNQNYHSVFISTWDVNMKSEVQKIEVSTPDLDTWSLSSDGKLAIFAYGQRTIELWDLVMASVIQTWENPEMQPLSMQFSPASTSIAIGFRDGSIALCRTTTNSVLHFLNCYSEPVHSVTFSPNGKIIVPFSFNNRIKLYDVDTGIVRVVLDHNYDLSVSSVSFSPDSRLVATGSLDERTTLWDVGTGTVLHSFQGHAYEVSAITFSPDGRLLASASDGATVKLWEVTQTSTIEEIKRHTSRVRSIAISNDGQRVATGSSDMLIMLWDVKTGMVIQEFKGHTGWPNSVAFSPDSKSIVSGSNDHTVRLWSTATGFARCIFEGHSREVNIVAFSPSGKLIASSSFDQTIMLWNLVTETIERKFQGRLSSIRLLLFSPDGKLVISGSNDQSVRVWDVVTGASMENNQGSVNWIDFVSAEGELTIPNTRYSNIRLWDAGNGSTLHTLETYVGWIDSIAFQQQGGYPRVFVENDWIVQDSNRLLWLPSDYRPTCIAVRENILALGHVAGNISVFKFNL